MESTGNEDRHNCRVFLLMTHCVAGGVPVGCFLTTSETQSTIEAAFRIYKELHSHPIPSIAEVSEDHAS